MDQELKARFRKFERFDLDGGHPVLDFTNTVDYRGTGREHDWLEDYADLLAWCHRSAFLPDPAIEELCRHAAAHPRQAAATVEQARELREAVAGLLLAALQRRPPAPEPLLAFNRHLGRALCRALLQPGQERAYILEVVPDGDPLEEITLRLARQAAELLTAFDPARLKKCDDPECGWMFLDTTRNASRRWCDMAACGNRAKARRFYGRKKLTVRLK